MLPLLHLQELKMQGVQFIVAPYEADAQMAYLARRGDVQLVITEDSDLMAYGCPRCERKHASSSVVLYWPWQNTVAHAVHAMNDRNRRKLMLVLSCAAANA
jgi:5'-3' exonuclease